MAASSDFYLSTGEPYYIGLANNSSVPRSPPRQGNRQSLQVTRRILVKTVNYVHDHGRSVVFWGEYSLKPPDIPSLPARLVNGETYGHECDGAFKAHGIREMVYVSTQGEERMFPDYFILPQSGRLTLAVVARRESGSHPDDFRRPRLPASHGKPN